MYMTTDTMSGGVSKEQVASCLFQTLADVFTMYFMAHSYHWNVKGPEFTQFHDFFSGIYDNLHDSVDPISENIRNLGFNSPMTVLDVANISMIEHTTPSCDPIAMTNSLYEANNICINALYATFACATDANEQGIANFIADRIGYHEKIRWQMGTTLGKDQGGMAPMMPGKSSADLLIEAAPVAVEDQQVLFASGSKPAPKKDRIHGSKTNKPGSATAKEARSIEFSDKVEKALENKMKEHNEKAPEGRKATMRQLKAVYRRGAGAFSSSHRPGKTRDQWAMARVNAYLHLLRTGRPENKNYVQDNDLLPSGHPKSSVTASALSTYESAEEAIAALAELSGLGDKMIPALRATWRRGVKDNENPFERAKDLAEMKYDSRDADLLPKIAL